MILVLMVHRGYKVLKMIQEILVHKEMLVQMVHRVFRVFRV